MTRARWLAVAVTAALSVPALADAKKPDRKKAGAKKDDAPPPMTSYEVELAIQGRETQIAVDRKRGIALLEEFIGKHATSRAMPEALYRLAALYWERSQEQFLAEMGAWAKQVDACKGDPEACPDGPPAEPQLDFANAQAIYKRLIDKYPTFRKLDTVRYLYGFSLRDQGKAEEAQAQFRAIIEKHPGSTFVPDAWLAIGDYRFYGTNDFKGALEAYVHVLEHPQSDAYAMALFKTAWCHWKLGDDEAAIRRFKEVLDQGSDPAADEAGRKRLADLREEALEYLVQVIAEDETNTPKDIYDFLASIDGAQYSRRVLVRLGEAYEAQTRYDKSVPTYRFLVALDTNHVDAADLSLHVFTGLRGDGKVPQALDELERIHGKYGPRTAWGKAHPKAAAKANEVAASSLYDLGRSIHENAQAVEQATKVPDKERYGLAARAYDQFIARYPSHTEAVELSYLAGDIYRIKLKQLERAGDSYLRVGESAPVGKLHRDALLAAIGAYEGALASAPRTPATSAATTPPPTTTTTTPPPT
ncbi:MAG TPA: tetratricopeptide repeat protein, partial [Nannocystaceae bacterium]|nr:tetratricopeptide repeat protein [Nannocystaceae bacterium]